MKQLDFTKFIRKYLKTKLIKNTDGFKNHETERNQLYSLLSRTIEKGESNSVLIIGRPGSGKTTMVNDVLVEFESESDMKSNTILIKLNGLVHINDNLALKSIATQMNIDESDGKISGTFAENLAFILSCLKSGSRTSKSLIFVIEEFDMFCNHNNQTLLYNLFDMTHNSSIPICVIGLTCRLDVTELFEKRVKSRFSHRQIFLFPSNEKIFCRIKELLSYTGETNKMYAEEIRHWNKHIESLLEDKKLKETINTFSDVNVDEKNLKNILISIVSKLNETCSPKTVLTLNDFLDEFKNYTKDEKVLILQDLSVLEICLLIGMKHHTEIHDCNPFNFEMILTRYNKFVNSNTLTNSVPRPVVMKAFEHITSLELISPIGSTGSCLQKEYQMYKLLFLPKQLDEAVKNYQGLPTEVHQWAMSSLS